MVSAYQYGQVSRYFQNLLLSVVLVRSGFPLAEIGAFEIIIFLITLLSQFWISGFREALLSKISVTIPEERDIWISRATLAYILTGFLAAIIFWCATPVYINSESDVTLPYMFIFGSVYLCFQAWSNLAEVIFLIQGKAKSLFVFANWTTLLFVILLFVFWYSKPDWNILFIILLTSTGVKTFISLAVCPPLFRITKWKDLFNFLKWSIPFFLIAVIGYGMEMLDGFLVVHFFEDTSFPIYKYGAREFPLSSLLLTSLSVAMIPVLQQAGQLDILRQKVNQYMHVLFPISIILIFISKSAFEFVYGEGFRESAVIFNLYLLVLGSRLLLPHSVLLAKGNQKAVLYSGIAEFLFNLVLSVWWVNYWGMNGLIAATVVAFFTQKIYLFIVLYKKWKLTIFDFIAVRWWLFYQLAAVVAVYLANN